jgi:hypothetical protein
MTIDLPELNEFERKQIERAIDKRKRYRYVRPTVRMVSNGILVESPCCSRRVDEAGGMVDVALLQRLPSAGACIAKITPPPAGNCTPRMRG